MNENSIDTITNNNVCKKHDKVNSYLPIDEYTFEHFLVGDSNKFAHAAALAVANNDNNRIYNPLFIYGNSGLGKTHLLNAIGNVIKINKPQSKVIYIKSYDFVNELTKATRLNKASELYSNYSYADYFLMDDTHSFSGKPGTQYELLIVFSSLYDSGTQIVFVSDIPPHEMNVLDNGLLTRFESCLIADIQPPDETLCKAIIKQKAEQISVTLPENVINYIAANVGGTNTWYLEGIVKLLIAYRDLMDEELTVDSVATRLRKQFKDEREISSMFCGKCGKRTKEGNLFCTGCGERLP